MPLAPGDVITSGHFSVEFDGSQIATFTEFGGSTSEFDVIDNKYQTADGKFVYGRLPGAPKAPTFTLKRGLTDKPELWAWHLAGLQGQVAQARKNGSLIFQDTTGGEVVRYNFTNGMVSKIEFGTQKAGANELVIESVTIVAETFVKG